MLMLIVAVLRSAGCGVSRVLVSLFATGSCFLSGEKGFGKKQLAGRCSVSVHCHGVTVCCRDVNCCYYARLQTVMV